jgi:co-chaperonin GroES (HSP10)
MSSFDARKFKSIRAIRDHVLVTDMNFKEKLTHSGIILPNSDGKLEGIHARWARVYAIGGEQLDIKVGQYILVKHGRWTRGVEVEDGDEIKSLRRVDTKDILLISNEPMEDETVGEHGL